MEIKIPLVMMIPIVSTDLHQLNVLTGNVFVEKTVEINDSKKESMPRLMSFLPKKRDTV